MFKKLQKLGKALMLPIAVLPVAGLLLRFGQADLLNIPFLQKAGGSIIDNLPLLFAIGIAVGLAMDAHGAAGLAGAISYLVITATSTTINDTIKLNAFGGIIAGITAGLLYNKFKNTKLPDFLGFFGGKRFVPIVTGGASVVLGGVLGYVWPPIQHALEIVGNWSANSGGIGEFVFGVLNRFLLPTGLHHVLNNLFWFQLGEFNGKVGDIGRFFAQVPAEGLVDPTAGMYMAGFFPVMMFGLPAAALAMYVCAKKENKAAVGGALMSVALTSCLTGITEPLEFMFMFLAPGLYAIHALLTGACVSLCSVIGIRHGFTFSAGLIDYLLNMGLATKGWLLLPIGLVLGAIYFGLFVFCIKKFNLHTPGREDDEETQEFSKLASQKGMSELAALYIKSLGGKENIKEVDACITRLRLVLKDSKIVEEKDVKALGASGMMRPTSTTLQVIVGTKAELVAEEMKKQL